MSEFPKLPNPPAVEAILDVKVVFPKGVDLTALAALHEAFKDAHPRKEEMRAMEFGFQQEIGSQPRTLTRDHGVIGYRFFSKDGKELVQCRKDGFTFNRLKPYTGWADVEAKAASAWSVYRSAFPQAQIARVALRYINQILVPMPTPPLNLDEYFTVNLPGPKVDGLSFVGFIGQSVLLDHATGLEAKWIFAHQPNPDPVKLSIVLDIDIFAQGAKALETDVPVLWQTMRGLKNRLFFGSITPKAQEQLFQ
jgi:uncharacterized protein (TIGR04255 family)